MIRSPFTLTLLTTFFCSMAFANLATQQQSHHRLHPLLSSYALTLVANPETGMNDITVTNNILWQNHYGNIHVNKRPMRLSALDSVIISREWEAMLKPVPQIIERAPIFVMIQPGQTTRILQNEFLTVLQDEGELHAQVTNTKNPDGCLTDMGCEADEIVLQ